MQMKIEIARSDVYLMIDTKDLEAFASYRVLQP